MNSIPQMTSYCQRCLNENKHHVLFVQTDQSQPSDFFSFKSEHFVLECAGCGFVSFRFDYQDEVLGYMDEQERWVSYLQTELYPISLRDHRDLDGLIHLPNTLRVIYTESLRAFKSECLILAGVGFRAVIEAICLDKKIKGRALEFKINNLQKEGLITKYECDRLHSVRFLGNDSVHEMREPTQEQLRAVLKIVEHLLSNLYILNATSNVLDTPINTFNKFIELVEKKLLKYKVGDEFALVQILEKDVRRVKEHYLDFEKQLIDLVSGSNYEYLTLGSVKTLGATTSQVQHYNVILVPDDEMPF